MPPAKFISRQVQLEQLEYKIIRGFAREKGLGNRGFSIALGLIVREWVGLRVMAEMTRGRTPANPYPAGPDAPVRFVAGRAAGSTPGAAPGTAAGIAVPERDP